MEKNHKPCEFVRIEYAHVNIDNHFPVKIYKIKEKFNQQKHAHDYIQLWYVLNGECRHLFNDKAYNLTKGNIFVLPPYVSHALISDEEAELIGLEFTENFISETVDKNKSFLNYSYIEPFLVTVDKIKPCFSLEGGESKQIESLLEEILTEFQRKDKYHELFIKADVLKILAIILRAYDKNINQYNLIIDRYQNSIQQALEYINEHYQSKIYLKDVCAISMMSTANFSAVFKHITGSTFTEYVNELRIKKAKELLLNEELSIRAIALMLGFVDTSYFNRVFKNSVGVSPLQYRKNIK